MPARLEALGTAAGLDRAALHSQLAAALSVVIHLVRDRRGQRRIAEVHVLERDPAGLVRTVPALRWGAGAFVAEAGWGRLRGLLGAGGALGSVGLAGDAVGPVAVEGAGPQVRSRAAEVTGGCGERVA